MPDDQNEISKPKRGFATMSAEKKREIASKGGRAAHEQGVAHQWTREEAKAAGKKGGQALFRKRKPEEDRSDKSS